jgi:hypothetical protein
MSFVSENKNALSFSTGKNDKSNFTQQYVCYRFSPQAKIDVKHYLQNTVKPQMNLGLANYILK